VSSARSVAGLAVAVTVAVTAALPAAEINEVYLEGYLTPPGALSRLELRPARGPVDGRDEALGQARPLTLVWIDGAFAAAGSERAARNEATRLLGGMGVPVSWRKGEAGEDAQPGEVRVILLDRGAVDRSGSPVLGSTPSQFEGERFFWVHVPSVRGAIGLDPRRAPGLAEVRDRLLLGIALGRVIAHELVHAVAPGVPHGRGLMSPLLRRGDLTATRIVVPASLGEAFRAALAGSSAGASSSAGSPTLLTVGAEREGRR
jgi:hypothetical protein